MLRIVVNLIFLGILILVIAFTGANRHFVSLHYLIGSIEAPLAGVLLLCVVLGAVLGVLFTLHWLMKLRYQNRRLRKANLLAEREIAKLRQTASKNPS
ncbi:MAG: LapA family protein [Gammaproteobacteria bacterium]|nr:LapA family protein [Gammaproteobacteria bacterium]